MLKKIIDTLKAPGAQNESVTAAKVVAVFSDDGSWVAFCGSLSETDDEIFKSGDPLTESAARELFFAERFKRAFYILPQ